MQTRTRQHAFVSVVLHSGERIESACKQDRATNSANRLALPQNVEVIRDVHLFDSSGASARATTAIVIAAPIRGLRRVSEMHERPFNSTASH